MARVRALPRRRQRVYQEYRSVYRRHPVVHGNANNMRTAVCVTGQSRSFGVQIANSVHRHIFSVLQWNGFDVFLVSPGPVRSPSGALVSQWSGNASLLEPRTSNKEGVSNKLFHFVNDEQHNLPFDVHDVRWKNNFLVKRTTDILHKKLYIQNLLYMAYDQYLCHNLTSSARYAAKLRMRPDMMFHSNMPWSTPVAGKILVTTRHGTTEDQFAFGTARDMNVYLSRYPKYGTDNRFYRQRQWTTESFLVYCLLSHNISLLQDSNFKAALVRTHDFTRLRPCTSELSLEWNRRLKNDVA